MGIVLEAHTLGPRGTQGSHDFSKDAHFFAVRDCGEISVPVFSKGH